MKQETKSNAGQKGRPKHVEKKVCQEKRITEPWKPKKTTAEPKPLWGRVQLDYQEMKGEKKEKKHARNRHRGVARNV